MNWQHMKTILWLRWRVRLNQLNRAGTVNTVLTIGLYVIGLVASVSMFFLALLVGIFALPKALPEHILIMWDIIVVGFLFFWMIGLVTELQRSDVLSFEKLLHLPISLSGAFVFNYVSSLLSFSLILFLPAMVGLSIALVVVKGPSMLVVFPLVAGFILMVTGVTYQLRGWLATLMVNKRRRRTIIAFITAGFIVLCQAPNLINMMFGRFQHDRSDIQMQERAAEELRLRAALDAGEIDLKQYQEQLDVWDKASKAKQGKSERRTVDRAKQLATTASIVLPPGWLAYGAMAAARHHIWPGLLGVLGTVLIGAGSLWRSYRTTLRFYRGEFQTGKRRRRTEASKKAAAKIKTSGKKAGTANWLEKDLPWFSEHSTVVALANFRSLIRAPEGKMILLSPIILFAVFGSMLFTGRGLSPPEEFRPLLGLGAITMGMFSLIQLYQNQFGFDRDGFRVYVLCPASRRDILLGKNLSLAPFALSIGTLAVLALQFIHPMRVTHLVATLIQLGSACLIVCMLGNLMSIVAPSAVAAGSLKSARPKTLTALLQVLFALLLPIALIPTLVPLGIELLLHFLGWARGFPAYMVLSAALLGIVAFVYLRVIAWQGRLLQRRQQKILDTVTTKNE
ncbi:MAG: hypothetical protein H8E44_14775 [Planctomycetes bacterium]|nr:hypothetical protein [Planctomycetota bacterium]MBL7044132.1 hypothetical protein [Pirellulaceae bacterium]